MITQFYARTAGRLYLVIAVFGAFAIAYVPSVIIVAGDASATANNLFPKLLGWMMLIGSFGYTLQALIKIMHIETAPLSIAIIGLLTSVTIGELAFAFWLLIKGINLPSTQVKS